MPRRAADAEMLDPVGVGLVLGQPGGRGRVGGHAMTARGKLLRQHPDEIVHPAPARGRKRHLVADDEIDPER